MEKETSELVKEIKRSFRMYMNGVTAASMRQKGLDYKINWGTNQMDLRRMAQKYGKNHELANALWSEQNIRECRLLATMIMPAEEMTMDEAVGWIASATNQELMEAAVFNLFQHMASAGQLSMEMLKSSDENIRMGAYNLVCMLLKRKENLKQETYDELFRKSSSDIHTIMNTGIKPTNRQLLHAIANCLGYVASSDTAQSDTAERILADAGL